MTTGRPAVPLQAMREQLVAAEKEQGREFGSPLGADIPSAQPRQR
jgi:hypothetical protein